MSHEPAAVLVICVLSLVFAGCSHAQTVSLPPSIPPPNGASPTWSCRNISSLPTPSGVPPYRTAFAVGVYYCASLSCTNCNMYTTQPNSTFPFPSPTTLLSLIFLNDMPVGWKTKGYFGVAKAVIELYGDVYFPTLGQTGLILFHLNGNCAQSNGLDVTYQALTVPGLQPIGIIGSVCTAATQSAALVAGIKSVPQISIAAASTALSDKTLYPTLFRTCATTLDQARMFLSFCQYYGLARVTVLYSNDASGSTLMTNMQLLLAQNQTMSVTYVPVAGSSTQYNFTQILTPLRDQGHRVFITNVVLSSDVLFVTAGGLGMYGPGYVWLTPYGSVSPFQRLPSTSTPATLVQSTFVASSLINSSNPMTQRITPWITSLITPLGEAISENYYYSYDATNTVLHAMSTVLHAHPTCTNYSCAVPVLTGNNRAELIQAISNTQIMSAAGYPLAFTAQGDRSGFAYNITQMRGSAPAQLQQIGLVFGGEYMETNAPIFPGEVMSPPTTRYIRYTYPYALVLGIWIVSLLTIATCVLLMIIITIYHKVPVIKASTVEFNYFILLGVAMLAGHSILYVTQAGTGDVSVINERELEHSTIITQGSLSVALLNGGARSSICHARVWLTPLSMLLILTPIFLKTLRIARIFVSKHLSISKFSNTILLFVGMICLLTIQTIWTIVLEAIDTPSSQFIINPNDVDPNDESSTGLTYWQCNTSNWFVGITIGYIGLITLATTYVAIRVRQVPQRFNESQQLLSIVLFIGVYSALVLPLQFSLSSGDPTTFTNDRLTQIATFRAAGLLLGAWIILAVLYIPKAIMARQGGPRGNDTFGVTQHARLSGVRSRAEGSGSATDKDKAGGRLSVSKSNFQNRAGHQGSISMPTADHLLMQGNTASPHASIKITSSSGITTPQLGGQPGVYSKGPASPHEHEPLEGASAPLDSHEESGRSRDGYGSTGMNTSPYHQYPVDQVNHVHSNSLTFPQPQTLASLCESSTSHPCAGVVVGVDVPSSPDDVGAGRV